MIPKILNFEEMVSLYISEFKEIIESKKSESDNDCLNNYPFLLDSLKLENISFSFKNRRIIDKLYI